jgi:hypothetical protein
LWPWFVRNTKVFLNAFLSIAPQNKPSTSCSCVIEKILADLFISKSSLFLAAQFLMAKFNPGYDLSSSHLITSDHRSL